MSNISLLIGKTYKSQSNSEANAFTGCAPTSPYLLTLNTNTNSATNIDSLVTIWESFDPNTNTTSYDTIIYNNPPYLSITFLISFKLDKFGLQTTPIFIKILYINKSYFIFDNKFSIRSPNSPSKKASTFPISSLVL